MIIFLNRFLGRIIGLATPLETEFMQAELRETSVQGYAACRGVASCHPIVFRHRYLVSLQYVVTDCRPRFFPSVFRYQRSAFFPHRKSTQPSRRPRAKPSISCAKPKAKLPYRPTRHVRAAVNNGNRSNSRLAFVYEPMFLFQILTPSTESPSDT